MDKKTWRQQVSKAVEKLRKLPPYSGDVLEDEAGAAGKTRVIGLTHCFTLLKEQYAVITVLTNAELSEMIAYLQLVRDDLPACDVCEDVLGESDSSVILEKLFGCKRLVSGTSISCESTIDLHDNWGRALDRLGQRDEWFAQMPVSYEDVAKSILDTMIEYAERSIAMNSSLRRLQLLASLKAIRAGQPAQASWGLSTIDGQEIIGRLF